MFAKTKFRFRKTRRIVQLLLMPATKRRKILALEQYLTDFISDPNNHPAILLAPLMRPGVTFTEKQLELIRSGNIAELQKSILEHLAKTVPDKNDEAE